MRCLSYMPQPWARAPTISAQTPSPAKRSPSRAPSPMPSTSAPRPDVSSAMRARRTLLALLPVALAPAMVMASMAEDMHQRAEKEKQVGQGAQDVARMGGQEVNAKSRQGE